MRSSATGHGIVRLVVAGNLLGAVLTFFYFRFVDLSATAEPPMSAGEIAYFVVAFGLLASLGFLLGRRWRGPLVRWATAPDPGQEADVRRRALLMPHAMAGVTLVSWLLAGLLWGGLWPWLTGTFSVRGALRALSGISVIAGSIATAFIFLGVERTWRRALPLFFPAGDLSATAGVVRVPVRLRLMVIFLMVSLVPLSLLGVMSYTRAAMLLGADRATGVQVLDDMLLFIVFMLTVGGLGAAGLAAFVSRSVAEPLREVEAAMREVARGRLEARCPVVSNDELGAVAEGFNGMVAGLRERERIREAFGKYVTREIRDEILGGRVSLEGQAVEVTILFSDLRDFTPWVESHDPREVVADLNAYFTLMEGAIRAEQGLVLQFIGDEIEAVFGAPVPHPDHAEKAVRAALDMRRRLAAWSAERQRDGKPVLRHGIGIHSGRVLAGNIGSPDRLSYALVGDAVNLASRIQALTKDFAADVLVSGATARLLPASLALEPLPAVMVKGKSAAVEVYRVAGPEPNGRR